MQRSRRRGRVKSRREILLEFFGEGGRSPVPPGVGARGVGAGLCLSDEAAVYDRQGAVPTASPGGVRRRAVQWLRGFVPSGQGPAHEPVESHEGCDGDDEMWRVLEPNDLQAFRLRYRASGRKAASETWSGHDAHQGEDVGKVDRKVGWPLAASRLAIEAGVLNEAAVYVEAGCGTYGTPGGLRGVGSWRRG